jgi:hypothetical protein
LEEWKQEKLIALNFEFERNEFDRRNTEYMPFNQARSVAQSLGFESMYDYLSWARGTLSEYGNFPTKLPRSPQQVYRGKGWTNWNDFLGTETKALKNQQAWEKMFLQYGAHV